MVQRQAEPAGDARSSESLLEKARDREGTRGVSRGLVPGALGAPAARAHWRPGRVLRSCDSTAASSRSLVPTSPRPGASGQPRAPAVAARRVTSLATREAQRARGPSRCAGPGASSAKAGVRPGRRHLTPPPSIRPTLRAAICLRWSRARPGARAGRAPRPLPTASRPRPPGSSQVTPLRTGQGGCRSCGAGTSAEPKEAPSQDSALGPPRVQARLPAAALSVPRSGPQAGLLPAPALQAPPPGSSGWTLSALHL